MARTKDEITAIAVANGYDGPTPKTKVEAINALALGYDGDYQKDKAGAIRALATVLNLYGAEGGDGGEGGDQSGDGGK